MEREDDWRPGFEDLKSHSGICPICSCMIMWHNDDFRFHDFKPDCRVCIDPTTGNHPLLREITEQDIFWR